MMFALIPSIGYLMNLVPSFTIEQHELLGSNHSTLADQINCTTYGKLVTYYGIRTSVVVRYNGGHTSGGANKLVELEYTCSR
jgi:hypothetical protein